CCGIGAEPQVIIACRIAEESTGTSTYAACLDRLLFVNPCYHDVVGFTQGLYVTYLIGVLQSDRLTVRDRSCFRSAGHTWLRIEVLTHFRVGREVGSVNT